MIPRPVSEIPKTGLVLVFKQIQEGTKFITYSSYLDLDKVNGKYEVQTAGWKWWLPMPEMPEDKDETDFEEWMDKNSSKLTNAERRQYKMVWMAARSKKDQTHDDVENEQQ